MNSSEILTNLVKFGKDWIFIYRFSNKNLSLEMFIFVYFFTQTDSTRTVQRSAFCRSQRELSNAYLLAKFGFDTAENEPFKVGSLDS